MTRRVDKKDEIAGIESAGVNKTLEAKYKCGKKSNDVGREIPAS